MKRDAWQNIYGIDRISDVKTPNYIKLVQLDKNVIS